MAWGSGTDRHRGIRVGERGARSEFRFAFQRSLGSSWWSKRIAVSASLTMGTKPSPILVRY